MHMPMALRLKLLRHRVLSTLGADGQKALSVQDGPYGAMINVEDASVHVPSPLRWQLYRKGWHHRLRVLEQEYGIGTYFKLRPGHVIIDIGANIGEFAHVGALAEAVVHCFEPDPAAFACLQANTTELTGITVHEDVSWKTDGIIEFGLAPECAGSSVFVETSKKISRNAVTLETFVKEKNLVRIDLLKCDAEGAEPEVLLGAEPILDRVACVTFDTGPERRGKRTHNRCKEILDDNGFDVWEKNVGGRLMTYAKNPLISPQP